MDRQLRAVTADAISFLAAAARCTAAIAHFAIADRDYRRWQATADVFFAT